MTWFKKTTPLDVVLSALNKNIFYGGLQFFLDQFSTLEVPPIEMGHTLFYVTRPLSAESFNGLTRLGPLKRYNFDFLTQPKIH